MARSLPVTLLKALQINSLAKELKASDSIWHYTVIDARDLYERNCRIFLWRVTELFQHNLLLYADQRAFFEQLPALFSEAPFEKRSQVIFIDPIPAHKKANRAASIDAEFASVFVTPDGQTPQDEAEGSPQDGSPEDVPIKTKKIIEGDL